MVKRGATDLIYLPPLLYCLFYIYFSYTYLSVSILINIKVLITKIRRRTPLSIGPSFIHR